MCPHGSCDGPLPTLAVTFASSSPLLDRYPLGYLYFLEKNTPGGIGDRGSALLDERERGGFDMDDTQQRDLSQRLSRIGGQVHGIKKMVDEGQDAAAILVQLMALQKATKAAAAFLVKAQATERIREQIRAAITSCPGECDHCDELVAIDHALDALDFESLLQAHLKVSE